MGRRGGGTAGAEGQAERDQGKKTGEKGDRNLSLALPELISTGRRVPYQEEKETCTTQGQ